MSGWESGTISGKFASLVISPEALESITHLKTKERTHAIELSNSTSAIV